MKFIQDNLQDWESLFLDVKNSILIFERSKIILVRSISKWKYFNSLVSQMLNRILYHTTLIEFPILY